MSLYIFGLSLFFLPFLDIFDNNVLIVKPSNLTKNEQSVYCLIRQNDLHSISVLSKRCSSQRIFIRLRK